MAITTKHLFVKDDLPPVAKYYLEYFIKHFAPSYKIDTIRVERNENYYSQSGNYRIILDIKSSW